VNELRVSLVCQTCARCCSVSLCVCLSVLVWPPFIHPQHTYLALLMLHHAAPNSGGTAARWSTLVHLAHVTRPRARRRDLRLLRPRRRRAPRCPPLHAGACARLRALSSAHRPRNDHTCATARICCMSAHRFCLGGQRRLRTRSHQILPACRQGSPASQTRWAHTASVCQRRRTGAISLHATVRRRPRVRFHGSHLIDAVTP
jgi:hypothetical protein